MDTTLEFVKGIRIAVNTNESRSGTGLKYRITIPSAELKLRKAKGNLYTLEVPGYVLVGKVNNFAGVSHSIQKGGELGFNVHSPDVHACPMQGVPALWFPNGEFWLIPVPGFSPSW